MKPFKVTPVHILCLIMGSLFVLSFLIPKGDEVLWINGRHSIFLDTFFRTITHLGEGIIILPFLVLLAFYRLHFVLSASIAMAVQGAVVSLLKRLLFVHAPRPRAWLDNNLLYFVPDVVVHSHHAFPSGHTVTAFGIATFIVLTNRNQAFGYLCVLLALAVGYSRIYLLQHFLMDVACGALIGCFTTYCTCQYFEYIQKPSWMNGRVSIKIRLLPGKEGLNTSINNSLQ